MMKKKGTKKVATVKFTEKKGKKPIKGYMKKATGGRM